MFITSAFEGGNIEVVSIDATTAKLEIKKDANPEYLQWFYFRCVAKAGQEYKYSILNAGECSFKEAWKDCFIVASYDQKIWFRLPTRYDGKTLDFALTSQHPCVYFAPFPPYGLARHEMLLAECQNARDDMDIDIRVYGKSVQGRALDLIVVGKETPSKKICWIVAGQHPGEPMARWRAEGIVQRLTDRHDATTRALLNKAVFYIVPNANPDGTYLGYIRTNAAGEDLNRIWRKDTPEKSPEIFYLKQQMQKTGVDCFIDIHGDEDIPHVFFSNTDGVPSMTSERIAVREKFENILSRVNPDFEPGHGYPTDKPGEADLDIGCNFIAETYKCFSVTLEQPFRDDKDNEIAYRGWSPERSQRLGASLLTALHEII